MRDFSRLDLFLDGLAGDLYPEPPRSPHTDITRKTIETLCAEGVLRPGQRVLDIGCGQGLALEEFRRRGIAAVGVTLGAADVAACREQGFEVRELDQNFLDFADGEFDFLWCRHVLEHSFAPLFTISEYRRLTRPGGHVYVEVPAPGTACRHEANPNHYSVFPQSCWLALFQRHFQVAKHWSVTFTTSAGPDEYLAFLLRNGRSA